ncbi:EF-hand domain-containing protein [Streptomyces erythrochromogenes]
MTEAELRALFDEIDTDGDANHDGVLDFEEFRTLLK